MKKNMFPRYLREMTQGLRVALCKILPGDLYSQTMFRKQQLFNSHQRLPEHFEQLKTTFFFLNDTSLVQTPVNEH